MVEHIWISTSEGGQLHGFIFVNLTAEQRTDLDSFMNKLGLDKGDQQHYAKRSRRISPENTEIHT